MKKITIALSLVAQLVGTVAAEPVSRRSADLYVSGDGRTAYATVGCTQTARLMEARIEENHVTGRPHLVFRDSSGEEEADCPVAAVVRAVPDPRLRGSARTRQTARRVAVR